MDMRKISFSNKVVNNWNWCIFC